MLDMIDFFKNANPIFQALLATLFTWGVTALGSSFIFFTKEVRKNLLDSMLGFASGVMIAASYWSLLAPAIELSEGNSLPKWLPAITGFLAGGFFLFLIDKILPHLHINLPLEKSEGIKTKWRASILLVLAITIHNFPEGLAVGVAFGAIGAGSNATTLGGAIALAIGIGIQNFPEGVAVSFPLRREGMNRWKAFYYGQLSAIVEPVGGLIGSAGVILIKPILPYALSFAAGAMVYVVIEELIPASKKNNDSDLPTIGAIIGFAVMMLLDVALG